MKNIIKHLTLAILLTVIAAPAAWSQIYCDDPDLVALIFPDEDINHAPEVGQAFYASLYLLNPSQDCLRGFECHLAPPEGVILTGVDFPSQAVNIGIEGNLIVGFVQPQQPVDNRIKLVDLTFVVTNTNEGEFFLSPSVNPSIPGAMVILDCGENLYPVLPIGQDHALPVARINGSEPLTYCANEGINGVTVGIACQGDSDNMAGASSWATDGFDPVLDLIDSDPDPVVYFPHPEWATPYGDNFKQDIIEDFFPTTDTRTWMFVVDSAIPEGETAPYEVTLQLDPSYAGNELIRTTLVDDSAIQAVAMEAPWQYTYTIYGDDHRIFHLAVGAEAITPGETDLAVVVDVIGPGHADLGNLAATAEEASDGFDLDLDLPEPGPPPGDYLTASFHRPGWPFGPRFRHMVHAVYDPFVEYKTWPLRVESDLVGDIVMNFTPSFGEGLPFLLIDNQTGVTHDLWPEQSFTFSNDMATIRDFTLIVGVLTAPPLTPPSRNIAAGWNLIGMPLQPDPEHDSLEEVVLGDFTGNSYIYRYLGEDGYELEEPVEPAVFGRGYWLGVDQAYQWEMEGDLADQPVNQALLPGWNLVGYPLWFGGQKSNIMVSYQGDTMPWSGAVEGGLITDAVLGYDVETETYVVADILTPWQGYWVTALVPGVELIFDWENFLHYQEDGGDAPRGAWTTHLTMRGRDGAAHHAVIGAHPEATAAFDPAHDTPLAPSTPFAVGRFGVRRAGWDLPCGDLMMHDMVSTTDAVMEWPLEFLTGDPGSVTLQWQADSWPAGLDLQLYSPAENRVICHLSDQSSVRLEAPTGFLQLVVRTASLSGTPDELPVHTFALAAHPNPFNPQTTIRYEVPEFGDVEIRIFTVRGELVQVLRQEGVGMGRHELVWQGRDRTGREVPSGSYFARLYLNGQAQGRVARMSLVR